MKIYCRVNWNNFKSYVSDKSKKKAVDVENGKPVVMAWEKMSKSKHNGVDPSDMFNEYGIDTTRLLILADVSPTSHRNWNNNSNHYINY